MDTKEYAAEIVSQMSSDDIEDILLAGDAEAWREGIGSWDGIDDLDALLEAVYEIISDRHKHLDSTTNQGENNG